MSVIFKSPAQLSQQFSSLQVPDSALGQAVPYIWGHCKVPHKLIFWTNFQSAQQGGKKGGKGGGSIIYTVNADMLIGYGPLEGIGAVWQNQTWFFVNYSSQTFTGVGTASSFSFTISNNASSVVMIMGVALQVTYSQAYSDYANPWDTRVFSVAGTSLQPLYNNQFPAPNYGAYSNGSQPYATYNGTYGSGVVTVHFPAPVTSPVVTIYYCEVGGSDQPAAPGSNKKGGSGFPVQKPGLTFERVLGSGPSGNPISYSDFSGTGGASIPLGPSPVLPFFNYEVKGLWGLGNTAAVASYLNGGYNPSTTSGDANPADVIIDLICSGNRSPADVTAHHIWNHGLGFSSLPDDGTNADRQYQYSRYGGILADEPNMWGSGYVGNGTNPGLNAVRNYCLAYGIFTSGMIDSLQAAAAVMDEFCKLANCAACWNGASLDFIPYCEVSAYGNGASYVPPTAAGPVFNLTSADFLPIEGKALVEVIYDRAKQNFNSLQVGYKDATQQFNDNFIIIADSADITVQGAMPGPQESYKVNSAQVAQSIGWSRLHRNLMVDRKEYQFSLPSNWEAVLTQMDLGTINEPAISNTPIPVRIKTIAITVDQNGKREMKVTAEPFIYGGSSPLPPPPSGSAEVPTGSSGGENPPGSVNAPIIFEAIPALSSSPEIWICLSGSGAFYGGCSIWLSKDGGSSYGPSPIGSIFGRQTMGVVYSSNYPSHADPDATNTLDVDLTESLGVLTPVTSTAQNAFASLWYLQGGGTVVFNGQTLTIPYELGAFQGASLLATNKYGLTPPNRRGVYGTPIVAHNIGSQFSYLNDGLVFKMPLTADLIGVVLKFKFTAFNNTGADAEALSAVTAYSFTPTGLVGFTFNNPGTPVATPTPTGTGGNLLPANDLYMYVPGTYTVASQEIWSVQPPRNVTLPAGLANSPVPTCDAAPAGAVTLVINKVVAGVATAVGSLNFALGATVGTVTFTAAVNLNGTGDILQVMAPSTPDSTLAGVRFTFWATRSN